MLQDTSWALGGALQLWCWDMGLLPQKARTNLQCPWKEECKSPELPGALLPA